MTTPEAALAAMDRLTARLEAHGKILAKSTDAAVAVAREMHIFNQIMLQVGQRSGNGAMMKMLLDSAARWFARRA